MICEQASDSYRLKANPDTQTPAASTTRLKSANNSPSAFMILSDHTAGGRADSLRSELFVGMRLLISLSQSPSRVPNPGDPGQFRKKCIPKMGRA